MTTVEEILNEKTFKSEEYEIGRRVFYTITDEEGKQEVRRISLLLSQLIQILIEKGVLTEGDIDELLLKCVGYNP